MYKCIKLTKTIGASTKRLRNAYMKSNDQIICFPFKKSIIKKSSDCPIFIKYGMIKTTIFFIFGP